MFWKIIIKGNQVHKQILWEKWQIAICESRWYVY